MASNSGMPVAELAGKHGSVTVLRSGETFRVVAGVLADAERQVVIPTTRAALAGFATDVLAHLKQRPTERVSVPYDAAFPVSAQLAGDDAVLNVLDDGDDLAVLVPQVKRGATRVSAAAVETFARALAEVTR